MIMEGMAILTIPLTVTMLITKQMEIIMMTTMAMKMAKSKVGLDPAVLTKELDDMLLESPEYNGCYMYSMINK